MTFFINRFLFIREEDLRTELKYELYKWQNAVSRYGLQMSLTEYNRMPIYIQDLLIENQKEISEFKSNKINTMIG